MSVMDDIRSAVINGDRVSAKSLVKRALADGADPARAMQETLDVLKPHLQAADVQPVGRVALAIVHGRTGCGDCRPLRAC